VVPGPAGAGIPLPSDERYNCGEVTAPPGSRHPFLDGCRRLIGGGLSWFDSGASGNRCWFESDHCFDGFISPVSNPFLFEDPRSLTEVRPIFIYQKSPAKQYAFQGGDIEFFGLQARLAFTDRFSIVLNKLGGIAIQPDGNLIADASGFAEVHIGPKFTFLRNDQTNTLGAAGLTFQIPTGPNRVFQDTGDLSLVPYVTFGQNFCRSSYGSLNALGTVGAALATDNQRSNHFFTSLHLDYDVANLHKIYPLVELNWFHYSNDGEVRTLGFEGRDLINFGSMNVDGNDTVSMATGLRYKFTEAAQLGLAAEFPLNGRRDLLDFRLTIDFILRY
jgi:hypothetical protein